MNSRQQRQQQAKEKIFGAARLARLAAAKRAILEDYERTYGRATKTEKKEVKDE